MSSWRMRSSLIPKSITQSAMHEIMKEAGNLLLSHFKKPLKVEKKGRSSIVSAADIAVEALLIAKLTKLLPEASLCAEESGERGDGEYQWVIDPLDGTTNFVAEIPHFCISIALTHAGMPIVGCTYQPITQEFFYAETNGGAYLNGERLSVLDSLKEKRDRPLIVYRYWQERERKQVQAMVRSLKMGYTARYMGAAALDLAYLAAGRIDIVLCGGMAWWDLAAGLILAQEAGAILITSTGTLGNKIAVSTPVWAKICDSLKK